MPIGAFIWAKLQFLRDAGPSEIGGFGIAPGDNLLLVEDFQLVRQTCTAVSVRFDDESVADFFDDQVDGGLRPEQFARVWLHTHPGTSAQPSNTDEDTFARSFGRSDWAVMFILAQGGETYARLRFNVGPQAALRLPVQIDYRPAFPAADHASWEREYRNNVVIEEPWPCGAQRAERNLLVGPFGEESSYDEQLWRVLDDENELHDPERSLHESFPGSF